MDTETRHFSAKRHPRLPAVVWIAACRRTAETTWLLGNWRVTRLSFRFPRLLTPGTLLRRVEVESPDLVSPQSGWTLLPRLRNPLAVRRDRSRSPQVNIDMTYQPSLTVCRVDAAHRKTGVSLVSCNTPGACLFHAGTAIRLNGGIT